MSKTVISVENLSKRYDLGVIGTGTLSRDLNRWWALIRHQPDPYTKIGKEDKFKKRGKSILALDNVSFKLHKGEALGIIGPNGAGKSTLLKILSRVTAPTDGTIKIRGRIGSLLEVGTGFHPELTGCENVFLNGAILGMRKNEVQEKFDEIVDFSGVEQFIDTPVKRYSSGMYVRLAFAVAAHLNSEILIVDEILAVGDAEFQDKCLRKMDDITGEGRTVLFVSHNLAAIQSLCSMCIQLSQGNIVKVGDPQEVIAHYLSTIEKEKVNGIPKDTRKREGSGIIRFTDWYIDDEMFGVGHDIGWNNACSFNLKYNKNSTEINDNVDVILKIRDPFNNIIVDGSTRLTNSNFSKIESDGTFSCKFNSFPLMPGTYKVSLGCTIDGEISDMINEAGSFSVIQTRNFGLSKKPGKKYGILLLDHHWENIRRLS